MYTQLCSLIKSFRENQTSELEVAICEKAIKGVSFQTIDQIYSLLEHWTNEKTLNFKGCFIVKDFFYPHSLRSRCILGYKNQGEDEDTQNITKTKIASIHAKCPERKYVEFHILLKDEIPYIEPVSPNNEIIDVRIQLMWEFEYKDAFHYFLKQVQTGKSVEDACSKEEILYEVEIELNRDCEYFKNNTDEDLAKKLIEKVLDLVGRKNPKTQELENLTMDLYANKKLKKEDKPKNSKKIKL